MKTQNRNPIKTIPTLIGLAASTMATGIFITRWHANSLFEHLATGFLTLFAATFALCAFTALTGLGAKGDASEQHRMKISSVWTGCVFIVGMTWLAWERTHGAAWIEQYPIALAGITVGLLLPAVFADRTALRRYLTETRAARNRRTLRNGTLYTAEQRETILRDSSIVAILPGKPRPAIDTPNTPAHTDDDYGKSHPPQRLASHHHEPDMPDRNEAFDRAAALAAEAHEGDIRKGTATPAIAHPIAVALTLAAAGHREDVVLAALLHDVVEDSDTTLETLRETFGDTVATLVALCTEPDAPELRWRDRKRIALARAMTASREVRAIMAADKAHNLRTIAALIERDGEDGAWRALGTARERQEPRYRALARIFEHESGEPFESLRRALVRTFGNDTASPPIEAQTQRWIDEARTQSQR